MLTTRQVILIKKETTTGTDAQPKPDADALLVNSLTFSNANARMIDRPAIRPNLDPLQQVYGGTLAQVQFTAEIKGSGDPTKPPEIAPALEACGFKADATKTTLFELADDGLSSVTIYVYQDGRVKKITGARGTVSFTLNAGELAMCDFTLTGHFVEDVDAPLVAPIYKTTVPVALIGLSDIKLENKAVNVGSISIDVGNNVVTPADITKPDGYAEVRIANRDVTGSIDPEMKLLANGSNFRDIWTSGANLSLTTGAVGKTGGNKFTITLPKISLREAAPGERESIITEAISFGATPLLAGESVDGQKAAKAAKTMSILFE